MNTLPPLEVDALRAALRSSWGFTAQSLDYAPLGFGAYHWVAAGADGARRFVTVDDLTMKRLPGDCDATFAALEGAYRSARVLYEAGLDFIVAPLPAETGAVVERLGERFCVTVFPFVEGRASPDGRFLSDRDRVAVMERVRELHRATALVQGVAARDDFALLWRATLEESLQRLEEAWADGPYAERARRLLQDRAREVREALAVYDHLVMQVRSHEPPFVITHGQPHAANVIWTSGGPQFVDWDSALLAPPARDFWMLTPYERGESEDLSLYRLGWELTDIAGYVTILRGPHVADADTAQTWRNLQEAARLESLQAITARRENPRGDERRRQRQEPGPA